MSLRIAGGAARGIPLRTSKRGDVRPTSGRVRSALFSMLGETTLQGSRVLDLYAGTGALAIEALSRGAEWADLVDYSSRQCECIRQNLQTTNFAERAKVWCLPVHKALPMFCTTYDLIFADPPYRELRVEELMTQLGRHIRLEPGATIVLEHESRQSPAHQYGRLVLWKQSRHGDSCLSLYQDGGDTYGNSLIPGSL